MLRSYFALGGVPGETRLSAVGALDSAAPTNLSAVIETRPDPATADYFVCVCAQKAQNIGPMVFVSSSASVSGTRVAGQVVIE
jgi:hypothetical protein